MPASQFPDTTGLILAGGRALRMGGIDKGLVHLGRHTMIEHVLTRFRPQVGRVMISANRNLGEYAHFDAEVVPDTLPGFLGPLAGIASGLQTAAAPYVAIVPCDAPNLPHDLVARLHEARARDGADLSVAHDGTRLQPMFALLSRSLLPDLLAYLHAGERKVEHWFTRQRIALTSFAGQSDAFANINDPDAQSAFEHQLTESPHQWQNNR